MLLSGEACRRIRKDERGARASRGLRQESAAAIVPMRCTNVHRGKGQTLSREVTCGVRWTKMAAFPRGTCSVEAEVKP